MHVNDSKCFKNSLFNQIIFFYQDSKIFLNNFYPKPQKLLDISRITILDGHKNQHTITCTRFNKDLFAVCATSKCMRYIKGDM